MDHGILLSYKLTGSGKLKRLYSFKEAHDKQMIFSFFF